MPVVIRASALEGVPHGFLGRRGGVSVGLVAGLNAGLGSDDDPAAIAENRARAANAVLPAARLVGLYQIHSAICVTVNESWDDADRPEADAMVTDRPGIALGILTVAEHVQDAATMSFLFTANLDYVEGNFLAAPGPAMACGSPGRSARRC